MSKPLLHKRLHIGEVLTVYFKKINSTAKHLNIDFGILLLIFYMKTVPIRTILHM